MQGFVYGEAFQMAVKYRKTIEVESELWEAGNGASRNESSGRPLCGNEFGTSAEHEEHKKIVHNVMGKKTNLSAQKINPRDLEPADDTPTTELPPGAEDAVNQGGTFPSSSASRKSKGAGR
jgi:hypothetical protein